MTAVPPATPVGTDTAGIEFQPLKGNDSRAAKLHQLQQANRKVGFNPSKEMTAVPPMRMHTWQNGQPSFQPLKGNDSRAADAIGVS